MQVSERYYTVSEIKDMLGLKDSDTVLRYLRSGRLKGVKPFGNRYGWRVSQRDLEAFMATRGMNGPSTIELPAIRDAG